MPRRANSATISDQNSTRASKNISVHTRVPLRTSCRTAVQLRAISTSPSPLPTISSVCFRSRRIVLTQTEARNNIQGCHRTCKSGMPRPSTFDTEQMLFVTENRVDARHEQNRSQTQRYLDVEHGIQLARLSQHRRNELQLLRNRGRGGGGGETFTLQKRSKIMFTSSASCSFVLNGSSSKPKFERRWRTELLFQFRSIVINITSCNDDHFCAQRRHFVNANRAP